MVFSVISIAANYRADTARALTRSSSGCALDPRFALRQKHTHGVGSSIAATHRAPRAARRCAGVDRCECARGRAARVGIADAIGTTLAGRHRDRACNSVASDFVARRLRLAIGLDERREFLCAGAAAADAAARRCRRRVAGRRGLRRRARTCRDQRRPRRSARRRRAGRRHSCRRAATLRPINRFSAPGRHCARPTLRCFALQIFRK